MIKIGDLLDVDDEYLVDEIIEENPIKLKKQVPWVDKYRPSKLDDIVYQDEVIKMLKDTLKNGNLQHLLFYGPPGTGKTSTILAIAKELYGPIMFSERVIELNASDERGINVVRNKIVTFAKTSIGRSDPNYLCPPYKIIILDEADAMTTEAQSALRNTMEDNSKITRFCFICNYINQITNPITSRCAKFRFKPLNEVSMMNKLSFIARSENFKLNDDTLRVITSMSGGDMRKGIMFLQNLQYVSDDNIITIDHVYEISSCITDKQLQKIKIMCIDNKKENVEAIVDLTFKLRASGYPIYNIINQIHNMVLNNDKLNDKMKALISIHFSKTEKRLIDGADEYLQLLSIFMCIKSMSMNINSIHQQFV